MLKRKTWLALGLAPALAATLFLGAACGGDDDDSSSPSTSTSTSAATGTSTAGGGESEIPEGAPFVDQDNLKFIPTSVEAKAGEKVYFMNSETAIHTVTIEGKNVSGNMRKGDVYVWTAGDAGTYKITCDFHPQMKATITIK